MMASIAFAGTVLYAAHQLTSGCGFDDGPFEAILINPIELSTEPEVFKLSDGGTLILENRNDTFSPIITLQENGNIIWSLDTDTRNTRGYEHTTIYKISDLKIVDDSDQIVLNSQFIGLLELRQV